MNEALILITMDTKPLDPPLNDMPNVIMESNLHDIHFNPYFDNVDDIYSNPKENETTNDNKHYSFNNYFDNIFL